MDSSLNNSNIILDPLKLPQHVAIIMDGNGRWAKSKGLPRVYGHKKGAEVAKKIIYKTRELGIPYLTLFAFSKENWLRPKEEIEALLELLKIYLDAEFKEMEKNGIKYIKISEYTNMPEMFNGRVKTLHPKIEGGILFRRSIEKDIDDAKKIYEKMKKIKTNKVSTFGILNFLPSSLSFVNVYASMKRIKSDISEIVIFIVSPLYPTSKAASTIVNISNASSRTPIPIII